MADPKRIKTEKVVQSNATARQRYFYCIVESCHANQRVFPDLSFHLFPKDKERRQQWSKILKQKERPITNASTICALHFKPNQFTGNGRLRYNAVPTADEHMTSLPTLGVVKKPGLHPKCSRRVSRRKCDIGAVTSTGNGIDKMHDMQNDHAYSIPPPAPQPAVDIVEDKPVSLDHQHFRLTTAVEAFSATSPIGTDGNTSVSQIVSLNNECFMRIDYPMPSESNINRCKSSSATSAIETNANTSVSKIVLPSDESYMRIGYPMPNGSIIQRCKPSSATSAIESAGNSSVSEIVSPSDESYMQLDYPMPNGSNTKRCKPSSSTSSIDTNGNTSVSQIDLPDDECYMGIDSPLQSGTNNNRCKNPSPSSGQSHSDVLIRSPDQKALARARVEIIKLRRQKKNLQQRLTRKEKRHEIVVAKYKKIIQELEQKYHLARK